MKKKCDYSSPPTSSCTLTTLFDEHTCLCVTIQLLNQELTNIIYNMFICFTTASQDSIDFNIFGYFVVPWLQTSHYIKILKNNSHLCPAFIYSVLHPHPGQPLLLVSCVFWYFIFLKDSLIGINFTYHITYPFKMYNSIVLSTFTELNNSPHNQF